VNRVLLDTNVVLDFLLDRAPFADPAAMLWQAGDAGRLVIYVSIITPINVFYIARKLKGSAEARQMTASLLASSRICCPTHFDLQGALALQLTDFEDAVQVVSATVESLDAIITRDPGDFAGVDFPVFSPDEFLARFDLA